MNLLELFDSRGKKKRLSHIRNLVALACSDGTLEKSENFNDIFSNSFQVAMESISLLKIH